MVFPYWRLIIFAMVLLAVLCAIALNSMVPFVILFLSIYPVWKFYKNVEKAWEDAREGQTNFLTWIVDHAFHTGDLDIKKALRSIFGWGKHSRSSKPKVKTPRTGGKFKGFKGRGNFKFK